jgi:uncharacterized protein
MTDCIQEKSIQQQGIHKEHQAHLDQGRFFIQRCSACSAHIYFVREVCPHCGSDDVALVAPSGLGTVHATTTVRRKPDAGGDYNVALIELDEGVRMMSAVTGVAPSDVVIGLRVQARVESHNSVGRVVFERML